METICFDSACEKHLKKSKDNISTRQNNLLDDIKSLEVSVKEIKVCVENEENLIEKLKLNRQLFNYIKEINKLTEEIKKQNLDNQSLNAQVVLLKEINSDLTKQCNNLDKKILLYKAEENNEEIKSAFQYRVKDVLSICSVEFITTPSIFAHGFKWTMRTGKHISNDGEKYLLLFLECINLDLTNILSFEAKIKLKVVCAKNVKEFKHNFHHIFTSEKTVVGLNKFAKWNDIIDSSTNNSIILEAVIIPFITKV